MFKSVAISLLVCATTLLCPLAWAKGSPQLIVISGGGLSREVEIVDSSTLSANSPWFGAFLDTKRPTTAEPACYRRAYRVLFYIKWPERKSSFDRDGLTMFYSLRYCTEDGAGYIYLPGRGDPFYSGNISTILRNDRDGHWSYSTPEWDDAVRRSTQKVESARIQTIEIGGGNRQHRFRVSDPDVVRDFDPWSARFIDWQRKPGTVACGYEYDIRFYSQNVYTTSSFDKVDMGFVYGVRFCFDKNSDAGYFQLADSDSAYGSANAQNVFDAEHAGRWYAATPQWTSLLRDRLRQAQQASVKPQSPALQPAPARLHDCLWLRFDSEGREFGRDNLDPLLWDRTTHLLTGASNRDALQEE